jgi:hypothetical protein
VIVSAPGAANKLDTVFVQRTVISPSVPTWRVETSFATDELHAVSGFGATNIMAVGTQTVLDSSGQTVSIGSAVQFNGSAWTRAMPTTFSGSYPGGLGVAAVPGGTYIAATSVTLWSYAGNSLWSPTFFAPLPGSPGYSNIHAEAANAIMAVGLGGEVVVFDGQSWVFANLPSTQNMTACWIFDPRTGIGVSATGEAFLYDTRSWTSTPTNTRASLLGLWAADRGFIVAVGSQGTILLFDGSTWSTMASPTTQTLHAVFGTSRTNIIAVGDAGTILRYDGVAWRALPSPTQNPLFGVWLFGAADGVAVGAGGIILRYTPQ